MTHPRPNFRIPLPWLLSLNIALTTALLLAFLPSAASPWTWLRLTGYAIVLVLPAYLLLYLPLSWLPRARPALWWGLLEGLRAGALLLDLSLFRELGIHIYSSQVLGNISEETFAKDIGLDAAMWGEIAGLFAAGIAAQALIWGLWRLSWRLSHRSPHGERQSRRRDLAWTTLGLLGLLGPLSVHLLTPSDLREQLSASLPLYGALNPKNLDRNTNNLLEDTLQARRRALRYPLSPQQPLDLHSLHRPDIVFTLSESTRGDMLNPLDMPLMTSRTEAAGGLRSRRHYSGGHQTWEGTFSLLYSLYGHHRDTFRNLPLKPYPLRLLKRAGYEVVALAASSLRHTGYDPMWKTFSRYESYSHLDAVKADLKITDRALELFAKRREARDKAKAGETIPTSARAPLFVLLFYNSTHHPFLFPRAAARFKPFLPRSHRSLGLTHSERRLRLWNRYRNAIGFLDTQLARLWDGLNRERDSGALAFLFMGDHGEEFYDQGQFGHAKRGLNNARVWTPFWLYFPGLRRQEVALSSHVDIFPTLFDLMKIPLNPEQVFDGRSILHPRSPPYVEVNAYNFPRSAPFALVSPPYKIFARRTAEFEMEINAVLDLDDRPLPWSLPDVEEIVRHFMRDVDRFYPGFHLFRSHRILQRTMAGYPFPQTPGAPRTAEHPERQPWSRLKGIERFVSDKPIAVQHKIGARIGAYVKLVGYNLSNRTPRMGDTIHVEYVYKCLAPIPERFHFFYHFFLPKPLGYQNLDHYPCDGNLPLSRWKPGMWIRDPHNLSTLTNWTPGEAELRQGIYDRKTGDRLPVTGGISKSRSVLVTTLKIGKPR